MRTHKEITMLQRLPILCALALVGSACTEPETENEHPVAIITIEAGGETLEPDQGIESPDGGEVAVTLDASNSLDEDGSVESYRWIRTDVSAEARLMGDDREVDPADETKSSITVSLPLGAHRYSLWVTDNEGAVSSPATVTLNIVSTAACKAAYGSDNDACASCMCQASDGPEGMSGCRTEVTNCLDNPDDTWTTLCTAVVVCAGMTGCESAGCYADDTCKAELDMAVADYGGFPAGCQVGPTEAPCPAATALGACQTEKCADVCN
ncbi:MAG: hypothetical protein OEZ06_20195 [Myxococcales bacterium]|nr:hypothetical protein [Myxococcales bacterium]